MYSHLVPVQHSCDIILKVGCSLKYPPLKVQQAMLACWDCLVAFQRHNLESCSCFLQKQLSTSVYEALLTKLQQKTETT